MVDYKEKYLALYNKKKKSAKEALDMIQSRDWIFTAQAAAEPLAIINELQHLKETGVTDIVLNTCLPRDYPALNDLMHHQLFVLQTNFQN